MASIFSKIVNGDIPAYKVGESDHFLAFLDINPLMKGHTLVIPKKEIDYLFDIDDELYQGMMLFAKKIAVALKTAVPCKRIGVVVMGLEVPHAHIHLIPMNSMADMNFDNLKLSLDSTEFQDIAQAITSHLTDL